MLAKNLKAGDQYRDSEGDVQITVILDAQRDGISPSTAQEQVVVGVRYRDGGSNLRWFDADAEVPYTRPEKTEV